MIKKLVFVFLAMFLALQGVFAETFILFKPFVSIFGENGIFGLLNNKFVVFALIFIAYLLGFFNILKIALKPVFGSSHQKETGTVAMMISLIGVTGMFYMFAKDGDIDKAIVLFGGSVGFFLLALIGASLIHWVYNIGDKESKWRTFNLLAMLSFVFLILAIYVEKMIEFDSSEFWILVYEFLYGAFGYLILGAIVVGLLKFRKKKTNEMGENKEFDPKVVAAKNNIDSIQKSVANINSSLKNIKQNMEVK